MVVAGTLACTGGPPPSPAAPADSAATGTSGQRSGSPSSEQTEPAVGGTETASFGIEPRVYAAPELVGEFDAGAVAEASAVAASVRTPGALYLLSDEGGPLELLAVDSQGNTLATVRVSQTSVTDAEGLAVAPCRPSGRASCVYVGDIGDNIPSHDEIAVIRFREPLLDTARVQVSGTTAILRYPERRFDAETLLVDDEGIPHVVTKDPGSTDAGAGAARLFAAPGREGGTLIDHGRVRIPPPRRPLASLLVGNVATGGDSLPGRVILRTYDSAVEYTAAVRDAPLRDFPRWRAREVPAAPQAQPEAVAYLADDCAFVTTSEGSGEIWSTRCASTSP